MSTSLEEELRTALRAHTADVTAPPGLAADVRRGAARRRLRTRLTVAATPLAVIAAVAAGAVALPRLTYDAPDPESVAAALSGSERTLLSQATEGDLAGDESYLTAVTEAWQRSHRRSPNADRGIFDHMLGSPTVVWAGRTPAGPAAVVVQVADLREHDNLQLERQGPALLWGYVGPGPDGVPALAADAYPVPGAPDVEGALIGPARRVLLVADRGRPVEVSFARTYTGDGYARRDWRPLRFAGGVAVVAVPDGTAAGQVRLRPRGGYAEVGNQTDVPADPGAASDDRLQWLDPGAFPVWPVGADPAAGWDGRLPDEQAVTTFFDGVLDGRVPITWPEVGLSGSSLWYAAGTTADGSRVVAGERQLDADPSRVYAVLRSPAGRVEVVARETDTSAVLPVRLRLPRAQGWLVAAKGAELSWRTGSGEWAPVGRDAALLPAVATEARVDGEAVVLR